LSNPQAQREKLRVIKLLNMVTDSGHTPLSWAAAYGNYAAMDLMLRAGASPGFTIPMVQASAVYLQVRARASLPHPSCARARQSPAPAPSPSLTCHVASCLPRGGQMSYRMYRMRCAIGQSKAAIEGGGMVDEEVERRRKLRDQGIETMMLLRRRREDYLNAILIERRRLRFPVPEAIYAGKWEVVKLIYDRELLHYNFLGAWSFPSPPLPFKRHRNRHAYNGRKISVDDILAHALSDMAAGEYFAKGGWVPPGDPTCAWGETEHKVGQILKQVEGRRARFIELRDTARKKRLEKDKRGATKVEYEEAIRACDWPLVMHYAQTTACSIDHETEDGTTPLIRACEEQVEALDYVYRRNEDGKLCMGVEYLLDRGDYRPALDIENKHGQTALIRACILNRRHALKALIDRKANVHYRNREGRTALHFAVMVGSSDCVLQLLDAGADPTVEDNAGVSCYAQAEENQYEHILNIMGAFKNGFTGDAKVVRGEDVPVHFMSCPFGCGAAIPPMEFKDHENVCAFRIVPCPNGCADKAIYLAMLPNHLEHLCGHRVVPCEFCKERYPLHLRAKHDGDDCAYRLVNCPYQCGELVRYLDVEKHFKHSCTQRPVACPQSCMLFVKACDVDAHCATFCVNRRVPCENGCGKLVMYKVMKNHVWDVCGLRKVRD
jgi:hypothetical protein